MRKKEIEALTPITLKERTTKDREFKMFMQLCSEVNINTYGASHKEDKCVKEIRRLKMAAEAFVSVFEEEST